MSSTMNRRDFLRAIGTLAASAPLAAVVAGAEAEEDSLSPVPGSGVAALPQLEAGPVLASPGDNIKLRVGDTSYYWLAKQKLQPDTTVGLEVSRPIGGLFAVGTGMGAMPIVKHLDSHPARYYRLTGRCDYCGSDVRGYLRDTCRQCGAPQ